MHARQRLREVLEGEQRIARALAALDVVRVVRGLSPLSEILTGEIHLSLVAVELFQDCGSELLPDKRVDRREQEAPVRREILNGFEPPACRDDGCEIVVGEVALDEPARRGLHESRARHIRVHIVEDDQVQPALQAACIGRHIGLNRLPIGGGLREALNGEINQRKAGHLLGPAIFENLKIVPG